MNSLWYYPEYCADVEEEDALTRTKPVIETPLELEKVTEPIQITFGGCGGLYSYFLGIASFLQQRFHLNAAIFSGASAGCFPALLLSLEMDIEHAFLSSYHQDLLREARGHPLGSFFRFIPLVRKHTLRILDKGAYHVATNRFFCSLTEVPWMNNRLQGEYRSNEELVDCMVASGFISIYGNTWTHAFRNRNYIDGSVSNNIPLPLGRDAKHLVFQVWKWRWINPAWFHISTCSDWTAQLFRWGKQDAMAHYHDLCQVLIPKS